MAFFGFQGSKGNKGNRGGQRKAPNRKLYLIMDRDSHLLAKGELDGHMSELNLQIRIIEGTTNDVVDAEIVQAIPLNTKESVILGKVILRRGSVVTLELLRQVGSEVRRHFRMPVSFESYLYPHSGGRSLFRSIDLSCGGIAFYSAALVGVGDDPEVVIPITSEGPLILNVEILRVMPFNGPIQRFACKFINVIPDQEAMLQEAVFNVQMLSIRLANRRKEN